MVQYAALRWADPSSGSHLAFTDNIRLLEGLALAGVLTQEDAEGASTRPIRPTGNGCTGCHCRNRPALSDAAEFAGLRERVTDVWQRLMEDRGDTSAC